MPATVVVGWARCPPKTGETPVPQDSHSREHPLPPTPYSLLPTPFFKLVMRRKF
ncbi:hypothetical protein [Scytonema hofmannii]|uniref:hypothetical protein n=1 Tax=Scytonema hofmannii TaxID=34078 RepID=UPI0003485259|nr:hypothetical protein [Scytonema hofmannii]